MRIKISGLFFHTLVLSVLVALALSACAFNATPTRPVATRPAARATPTPPPTCQGVACDKKTASDLGCRSVALSNPGKGTDIGVSVGKDEVGTLIFEGNLEDQRSDDSSVIRQKASCHGIWGEYIASPQAGTPTATPSPIKYMAAYIEKICVARRALVGKAFALDTCYTPHSHTNGDWGGDNPLESQMAGIVPADCIYTISISMAIDEKSAATLTAISVKYGPGFKTPIPVANP